MPSLDIFSGDAFNLTNLSLAMNDQPYTPTRISDLKLFSESGINTTSLMIEREGTTLSLVPAGVRGQSGVVKGADKRSLVSIVTTHLPQRASVLADEVLNVRAFGSETELMAVQTVVNKRLAKMKRDLDVTMEYQRLGAIKGQVLDADGTTVLLDSFTTFGFSQQTQAMTLSSNTNVRNTIIAAKRKMESALGALGYSGIRVLCSPGFFDALVGNDDVKKAWEIYLAGSNNRDDLRDGFTLARNVVFEEYRGTVGGVDFITDGQAFMVPEGVADMFIGNFAPADYMETAGTNGLKYYAKQEPKPMNKGIDIESQSNPIFFNTRPNAVIKLTA